MVIREAVGKIIEGESSDRMKFLVDNYYDCNSILTILPQIKDEALKSKVIDYFESNKPNYVAYVNYKENIKRQQALEAKSAVGSKAPEFMYPTDDGKKLGPKSYKGKYLLIDFWASWCGPCRKEIPVLKQAYQKFAGKDIEFMSVSIYKDRAAWLKAVGE